MQTTMRYFLFLGVSLFMACQAPTSDTNKEQQTNQVTTFQFPIVEKPTDTLNVAFLVMEGVYNTELTAPIDIFQHSIFHTENGMKVFTIAKSLEPLTTFEGLKIIPDYSYKVMEDVPKIDILVVPSAEHHLDTDLEDEEMIAWVKSVGEQAKLVLSLCDGAFVLAKAGLLDEVESTTFPDDIEQYKTAFPHLKVHKDVLFVHDGKFITSAGGAKSFEASLYIAELLYGKKVADGIARGLVIDWDVREVPSVVVLD